MIGYKQQTFNAVDLKIQIIVPVLNETSENRSIYSCILLTISPIKKMIPSKDVEKF
jgi:hypothetical protein